MRNRIDLRPNPALAALCAGLILGVALATGGCATAQRAEAPPVLPAARVDYAAPRGPRQVTVAGPLFDVEKRANALMLQGWKMVPHGAIMSGDGSTVCGLMVLEYKPTLPKR